MSMTQTPTPDGIYTMGPYERRGRLNTDLDYRLRAWVREVQNQYAGDKEKAIKDVIGATFRGTVNVSVRKPRFMPDGIYKFLMRTIIVAEGPFEVKRA